MELQGNWVFVQARIGSTRLPKKALLKVLDKELLEYLLERISNCQRVEGCALLIPEGPEDLPLEECLNRFIEKTSPSFPFKLIKGSMNHVLSRFEKAFYEIKPKLIVRITGDCPLMDPEVIDIAIDKMEVHAFEHDYVSNIEERTYPRGLDVEVIQGDSFLKLLTLKLSSADLEHVTPKFYSNPKIFHTLNFKAESNFSNYRLCVDTKEDFSLIEKILKELYPQNPHFRLNDLLELLKKRPDWLKINQGVQQKEF